MPNGILPEGLQDALPLDAAKKYHLARNVADIFEDYSYERIDPPLLEFADILVGQESATDARQSFHVMDPQSRHMLALRSDMTPQIARIASTRLAHQPRPLRLSYVGAVLRTVATQMQPLRQRTQAGIEYIGEDNATAVTEVILVMVQAIQQNGLPTPTIDLCLPPLLPQILVHEDIHQEGLLEIIERKEHHDALPAVVQQLLAITNQQTLASFEIPTTWPDHCKNLLQTLKDTARAFHALLPDVPITIDLTTHRGFSYHTGVCFNIFLERCREEIGRGGAYQAPTTAEPAIGATMYLEPLLSFTKSPEAPPKILLALKTEMNIQDTLRHQGYTLLFSHGNVDASYAIEHGCNAYWDGSSIQKV